jgi:hypothetical protein
VVTADAADASRVKLAYIQVLGYGDVMALPRTWKCATGKALKDLGPYLPRSPDLKMRMPTVNPPRRRTLWAYAKRVRPLHLGDVRVVRSTCRCHDAPRPTQILVAHLPETVTARAMVGVYPRRLVDRAADEGA